MFPGLLLAGLGGRAGLRGGLDHRAEQRARGRGGASVRPADNRSRGQRRPGRGGRLDPADAERVPTTTLTDLFTGQRLDRE